jgi:hypothetical protein
MAYDFPNAPTVGQTYQGYIWDGLVWKPATTVAGNVRYDMAQALTAAQQAQALTNIGAAPYDAEAYNNILLNGGMEVDQEHGGAATAGGVYAVDGFFVGKNGSMVISAQQVADAPPGFSNSLKITVTTAEASLASGESTFITQYIEGVRTSRLQFGMATALSVTLGFWTKIHRIGTYSGSIRNHAANRAYPFTFTQNVADVWEFKTVTIPGDVSGTWVGNTNLPSLDVFFCIASGTALLAPANAWAAGNFIGATGTTNGVAATTDIFQVTGVSLLPGTIVPTPAQSVLLKRSFDRELLLCRRYWWCSNPSAPTSTNGLGTLAGYTQFTTAICFGTYRFTVPMRVTPTLQIWSNNVQNNLRNAQTGAYFGTGGNPANTYFGPEGGSQIGLGGTTTQGVWCDFDLIADARM